MAKVDWKRGDAAKVVEKIERTKESVFVSLHHHTTFSYKDGYGTPETHAEEAARRGAVAQAVTEHGNVSSHVRHEQACDDHAVKPIYGVELYCGKIDEENRSRRKNHLTVLARNDEGYRNVLRMVSRGFAEGWYYEPTVSGAMLREHREGIIALSGCAGSLLSTSLIGGKNIDPKDASYARGKRQAEAMREVLGDGYFLEVQAFPELEKTRAINENLARLSNELHIPLVATLDVHYTMPGEEEIQQILHNSRPGKKRTMEEQARNWGYDVPLRPLSDKEIFQRLVASGLTKLQAEQAIRMSRTIADMCNVRLPKVENLKYPLPGGLEDNRVLFRQWVNEGWKYRGFNKLTGEERQRYVDRVKYEMDLIEQKGFIDYFLLVSDITKFCKDVHYRPLHFQQYPEVPVGPARGSAAASLVCYLLRITEVNPMFFPTLLFERFIDINRHDLPDIDLDFDDEYRWLVKAYAEWKYGAEKVGNIGTFVKFKGKNSLDTVAMAFGIPEWKIKEVKDLLITRSSGDLRAGSTIEDSIEMFPRVKEVFDEFPELYKAQALEGNYAGMSIHAAGLVIANGPLTDVCAIYTKTDEKTGETVQVVSLDKYDAEYLNVMKLDALGLNTMALIRIALEYIGMRLSELYSTPLDEEEALRGFQANDVVGVFQFDGRAMRSVNQGVRPDNFMEVADVNALARPGPLHSGATAEYIDVKHGRKDATHYHDIVDEITRHTNFQVVYQEQILQIVRILGGFSWEDAARIRKIISKKRGEQEFNQQRDKFVDGAATHGMTGEQANKVFSMLATAGAYAFNAAHCVSYGMLAYWTMYLKREFPKEFYTAALRKYTVKGKDAYAKRASLLGDMVKHGIEPGKLHLNKSARSWSLADGIIRPGFTQVKGIGDATFNAIEAKRTELGGFKSWKDVASVKGVGPVAIEKMQEFIEDEDPFRLHWMAEKLERMRKELQEGIPMGKTGVFSLPVPSHTAAEIPYERTQGNVPVVWLGVLRSRNLKDLFEAHHSRTGSHLDPKSVKRPDLNEWVVMTCEDETDTVTVSCNRFNYRQFKDLIWDIKPDHDLVLFRGTKLAQQARRAIYITDMWILDQDEDDQDQEPEEAEDV